MRVVYSHVDTFSYSCKELGNGLYAALGTMRRVAEHFARDKADDSRTLVVVLCCPCCSDLGCHVSDNAILVSPLAGVDPDKYRGRLHRIDMYPPFSRADGRKDGCATLEIFAKKWRECLEQAVSKGSEVVT